MARGCKPGSCWRYSLWVDLEVVGDTHVYNTPRELTKSCTGKKDKKKNIQADPKAEAVLEPLVPSQHPWGA